LGPQYQFHQTHERLGSENAALDRPEFSLPAPDTRKPSCPIFSVELSTLITVAESGLIEHSSDPYEEASARVWHLFDFFRRAVP
jgi:hypothetical protein